MTTITLAFEHAPASGQATKELPVRANMDEAFFKNTREFLPWDISNGTATLPYLAFEKFLDLVGVPRVLEHDDENALAAVKHKKCNFQCALKPWAKWVHGPCSPWANP